MTKHALGLPEMFIMAELEADAVRYCDDPGLSRRFAARYPGVVPESWLLTLANGRQWQLTKLNAGEATLQRHGLLEGITHEGIARLPFGGLRGRTVYGVLEVHPVEDGRISDRAAWHANRALRRFYRPRRKPLPRGPERQA